MLADVFTAPERTLLKIHGGDCFVQGTKVLKQEGHALVPIESLREGDFIWGYNKWSRVTKVWGDKGVLKTWLVRLNNGSSMRLTPNHKVWVQDETLHRIHLSELKVGAHVTQPDWQHSHLQRGASPGLSGLRVKEIIKDDIELPCWDIETDDHFVWLPEADWTTSQCDDASILLGSMLMSVGHPVRLRIIATMQEGQNPATVPWSHIYLLTPTTFDNPKAKWIAVDGSMDRPLGWEAPGASEVARTGKPSGMVARVRDYTLIRPSDSV
jgi:hypothetical protein